MKIIIEHHGDQFNVALQNPGQDEPFVTIKGCRIVNGSKGPFVSFPAKKLDSGKYWNHVYASQAFSDAIIRAANQDAPPKPRQQPARQAPKQATGTGFDNMDDDIPF